MNRLLSIRSRITIAATAVFGLAMVVGGWFLLDRAEQAWIDDIRAADLAELEVLAGEIQALEQIFGSSIALPVGDDGTTFELFDSSGVLIAETPQSIVGGMVVMSGPVPIDQVPPEVLSSMDAQLGIGLAGEVTSVSLPVELDDHTVTLTASSSLEPVQAGVDALRSALWIAIPLLVVGVGLTSWWVTGRAFRPVEAITNQVGTITDGRLDERVPVPSSRDEVAHLATTMNRMLDRLSASRRRQREFVSDASHELRNPIAASRTKLEVALAHPDQADWIDTAEVVLSEQERLSSLVDSLLELARLDEGAPSRRENIDLDDIVFAEASRATTSKDIKTADVQPVQIEGDPRQITHAVRNLMDNAARNASGLIVLGLHADDDVAVLTVDDDGPGIPPSHREAVFERFVRVDESRGRGSGGAGLGLALVAAVAASHGGSATATDSELGGARIIVRLPRRGRDA